MSNRVAVVAFRENFPEAVFLDDTPAAPKTPGLATYWYTVRSVHLGACDPILSPHSAPASGVLRQRDGPGATTGSVLGSCGQPIVLYTNLTDVPTAGLDARQAHYRLICQRRDFAMAWMQFHIQHPSVGDETIGPIYFPGGEYTAAFDYALTRGTAPAGVIIECTVGTFNGQVSVPSRYESGSEGPVDQRRALSFFSGQVLETALKSDDPLLVASGLIDVTRCIPALEQIATPHGTVTMRFNNAPPGPAMQIQANRNGTWTDVGLALPDVTGHYAVSFPECITAPLPQFRGCPLAFPVTGDCAELAPASASGPSPQLLARFNLTPRSREFRLYRQVGEGPLTMISQGPAAYVPGGPNVVMKVDDALPAGVTRLCYFVQLLDEHGNPSPMAQIGCRESLELPTPSLSEPQPLGDRANTQVLLKWFCPPAGVDRFRVFLRRKDASAQEQPPSSQLLKASLFGASVQKQINFKSQLIAGMLLDRFKLSLFQEAFLTAAIGPSFGPGPDFSLTANVQPNVTYLISIAAVDVRGTNGSPSKAFEFTWSVPPPVGQVPWPPRPLPIPRLFTETSFQTNADPYVHAALLTDANFALDERYPVGIRIGILPQADLFVSPDTVRTMNFIGYLASRDPSQEDPSHLLFKRQSTERNETGQPLLPIVVYRQQITNLFFQRVSGDLAQVTPLIEKIPWTQPNGPGHGTVIPDLLFGSHRESFLGARLANLFLYVRDLQPVIRGAAYRYYVVRFNASHEIDQVIPAGDVEIPLPLGQMDVGQLNR